MNGSSVGQRLLGLLEHGAVEQGRVRLDVAEEEAGERRELGERRDLLLNQRRGLAHERLVPVVAPLAQELDEPVRVLIGRELAQVDAVQPLELLEVEDGGARTDALEREALDELFA